MTTFRVIGPGRAGRSLMAALGRGGYEVLGASVAATTWRDAAAGVDLLVIATPDDRGPTVAAAVAARSASTVVIHLSGSLGLDVLAPPPPPGLAASAGAAAQPGRRGRAPAARGSPSRWPATRWPGRWPSRWAGGAVEVDDTDRAAYHAAASIAANHLVALLGPGRAGGRPAGLPLDAFADLMRAAVDDALRPRAPARP